MTGRHARSALFVFFTLIGHDQSNFFDFELAFCLSAAARFRIVSPSMWILCALCVNSRVLEASDLRPDEAIWR